MNIRHVIVLTASMAVCQICLADQFIKYPSSSSSSSGTVTSITAGTGLTGGTITTSGTIALSVPVSVANGGTNATTAGAALTSLGAAASGANVDITSLGAITKLFPAANSTTAIQVDKADGSTVLMDFDTTNARIGISSATPGAKLDIDGTGTAIPLRVKASQTGDMFEVNQSDGSQSFAIESDNKITTGTVIKVDRFGAGASAGGPAYSFANDVHSGMYLPATNKVAFSTSSTEAMRIDSSQNVGIGSTTPGAKLDVVGTVKLGAAGVAFTAAGGCTVASTTLSTTATNLACTGVPASAAVAVTCSGQAAFSTPTASSLYCRATGTVDQIACNTVVANTQAMAYSCSWIQP